MLSWLGWSSNSDVQKKPQGKHNINNAPFMLMAGGIGGRGQVIKDESVHSDVHSTSSYLVLEVGFQNVV